MDKYSEDISVVTINDVTRVNTLAHLFKLDSTYGRYDGEVQVKKDTLLINGRKIKTLSQTDPARLSWYELDIW